MHASEVISGVGDFWSILVGCVVLWVMCAGFVDALHELSKDGENKNE